ncbi:MAG: hypothetical protein PHV43_01055 [Candidatus Colwellbacteria bacterium]|nr:hypothetical protein [Candidatus Colwellbacteria bacterium]
MDKIQQNSNNNRILSPDRRLSERVYYVSCPSDSTVLVGMNVIVSSNLVRWFDTVKERIMELEKIVDDSPGGFSFKRQDGGIYTFVPMTMEIYEDKVRKHLISPPETVGSLADLFDMFEKTREQAW